MNPNQISVIHQTYTAVGKRFYVLETPKGIAEFGESILGMALNFMVDPLPVENRMICLR